MAEHLTVDQVVVGSTPIAHPKIEGSREAGFFCFIKAGVLLFYLDHLLCKNLLYNLDCIYQLISKTR